MTTDQDTEIDMPIVYDGTVVAGANDDPLRVYQIKIDSDLVWFIGDEIFEPNGNDFKISVSSFGLKSKDFAGSTGDQFRAPFQASLAARIEERLRSYFTGNEDKRYFPFTHPKAKCIGTIFSKDWILYQSDP